MRAAAVMPAHLLTPVIVGISAPATIAVTMVLLDWGIGVPLLVAVPLVLLLARVLSRLAARTEAERHRAVVAVDDRVLEFARAQAALRAAGRAQDPGGYAPLRRALEEQDAAQRLSLRRSGLASGLNGIVVQTVLTALVVLVDLLVLGGSVTGLEALALLVVASRFTAPLTDVADFGGELRNAQGELERIRRVLAVEPLPEPSGADGTDAADSSAPQRASTADETEAGPAAAGDGADRIRAAIAQTLEDEPLAWFRRKLEVVLAGIGARLVRGSGEAP